MHLHHFSDCFYFPYFPLLWFWALGMVALGLLVLAGGVILLAFSYRLEDTRLMQVYGELQEALKQSKSPSQEQS